MDFSLTTTNYRTSSAIPSILPKHYEYTDTLFQTEISLSGSKHHQSGCKQELFVGIWPSSVPILVVMSGPTDFPIEDLCDILSSYGITDLLFMEIHLPNLDQIVLWALQTHTFNLWGLVGPSIILHQIVSVVLWVSMQGPG